jgi:hypothetical protein
VRLEALGEPAAALKIAAAALDGWPPGGSAADHDWLVAAVLRLAALSPAPAPPLVAQLIAEITASGAGLGLEARIWTAIDLLRTAGQRATALGLADQAAAALDEPAAALGRAADQWRLLLAFHVGRAGHPALTERLLAPLLDSGDDHRENTARAVLYACAGPRADTRLRNVCLEAELAALLPDADDDRLRIHHVLGANYGALAEYRQALTHSQRELTLRIIIQPSDHPDILTTRSYVASWTGRCGDAAGALRLFRELLPDQERVLGPDHQETLATRGNIATWTGRCGPRPVRNFSSLERQTRSPARCSPREPAIMSQLMSRSVDLCDQSLQLARLRGVDLNGWSGGCPGHLFGFGTNRCISAKNVQAGCLVQRKVSRKLTVVAGLARLV